MLKATRTKDKEVLQVPIWVCDTAADQLGAQFICALMTIASN